MGSHPRFIYFPADSSKCCDGGKAFSHQEALWATGGMFATHYDVDSGLIEMLVCLALAIIP